MKLIQVCNHINLLLDIPITFLFLIVGLWITILLKMPQVTAFKRFWHNAMHGFKRSGNDLKTLGAFQALFTAMATTIGIGTVVGPSLAIVLGGPGALFWLIVYALLGSATKLVEVSYAIAFRHVTPQKNIIGGPVAYLRKVHPYLGMWYGFATLFLFATWSGVQTKAFSEILAQQGVSAWISGLGLSLVVFLILAGGVKRVGYVASKLVPVMFFLYVSFACWVLWSLHDQLGYVFSLIGSSILQESAPIGGFVGASLLAAMRQGTYKGIFITESGMGTASIAQAMSDVQHPVDQGILAMYGVFAEAFLCFLSGLMVLVTGVWQSGIFSSTLMLRVFQVQLPGVGPLFFTICIMLFILTTAIGNAFNGGQSFTSFFSYRFINYYYAFICAVMFFSCLHDLSSVWAIADGIFPFVAVPNLLGVLILLYKYPNIVKIK